MGAGGSLEVNKTDEELCAELLPVYSQDPERSLQIISKVQAASVHTKPRFLEGIKVCDIEPVPEEELESFKEKYLSTVYLPIDSPEAQERLKKVREIQYKRWNWACQNVSTYVNILRASNHTDEKIQAMFEGRPMCFKDSEEFEQLKGALKELAVKISEEKGWGNVHYIITGSSVPGFSQNPCKGSIHLPSKITNPEKSDVDICIVADGVLTTYATKGDGEEPKKKYTTTSSPMASGIRFGCKDLNSFSPVVAEFHKTWSEKLQGGLQLTFSDHTHAIPPWEARLDIA